MKLRRAIGRELHRMLDYTDFDGWKAYGWRRRVAETPRGRYGARRQLRDRQTMDLGGKANDDQDPGRPSSYSAKRIDAVAQVVSDKGRQGFSRTLSPSQREKPASRDDSRSKNEWPDGQGRARHWRPAKHVNHHRRRGARDAASQRPDRGRAHQVHRSHDRQGVTAERNRRSARVDFSCERLFTFRAARPARLYF